MSAADLYSIHQVPLSLTIKLHGTDASVLLQLYPGKSIFDLKRAILLTTNWFEGSSPCEIVIFQEGENGKVDSPTLLHNDTTLIVKSVPPETLSIQVSQDRGDVSMPWIRPWNISGLFGFVAPLVTAIVFIDTSVLKAIMLGEMPPFPYLPTVAFMVSKKVVAEFRHDARFASSDWPSSVTDCSHMIQGFTQSRQTTIYEMLHRSSLEKILGPFDEFERTESYPNMCNDAIIFFEALILARFARISLGSHIRTAFITFDAFQAKMAQICKEQQQASDVVKLLVKKNDLDLMTVHFCPDRQFPSSLLE